MRTIKFRAFHQKLGQMLEPFNPFYERMSWKEGDSCVFMQYTGLKDKNGKEIYEGDILCIENYYHDYQDGIAINSLPDNKIEAVEWDSKHGMWITESDSLAEQIDLTEIIGNIYENPELLK